MRSGASIPSGWKGRVSTAPRGGRVAGNIVSNCVSGERTRAREQRLGGLLVPNPGTGAKRTKTGHGWPAQVLGPRCSGRQSARQVRHVTLPEKVRVFRNLRGSHSKRFDCRGVRLIFGTPIASQLKGLRKFSRYQPEKIALRAQFPRDVVMRVVSLACTRPHQRCFDPSLVVGTFEISL